MSCLESGGFAPRAHLLSCLADLFVQPTAADQCREWRGKHGQSSVQLLLQIWAEEEARLGEVLYFILYTLYWAEEEARLGEVLYFILYTLYWAEEEARLREVRSAFIFSLYFILNAAKIRSARWLPCQCKGAAPL